MSFSLRAKKDLASRFSNLASSLPNPPSQRTLFFMTGDQKHWFLIGGGGFLGTNLVRFLSDRGEKVTVIDRKLPVWAVRHPLVSYIEQDAREILSYASSIPSGAIVVYLAANSYPGKAETMLELDIQDNIAGVVRVALVCADVGVANFLFSSSGGAIYGDQDIFPIKEGAACFPKSAYGAMKLSSEHYLRVLHGLRDMPVACLRIGNAYGPWHRGSGQGFVNVGLASIHRGEPIRILGDGLQTRDHVFVDDVADAVYRIGSRSHVGWESFNIGTGVESSLLDIVEMMKRVTGVSPTIETIPSRFVDVHRNALCFDKIQERHGWRPEADLETGMRKTWEWILSQDES